MDFMQSLSSFGQQNSGSLLVGALFALYLIGDKVWQESRERRQQTNLDDTTQQLLEQLTKTLKETVELSTADRGKIQTLNDQLVEMARTLGRLESSKEHSDKLIQELEEQVSEMTDTIRSLVEENRNKDHSITELVKLNRKLLQAVGCETPERM